jgi:hypothetical protein
MIKRPTEFQSYASSHVGKKHPPAVLWQNYFERKCTLTPIYRDQALMPLRDLSNFSAQ